uniref:LisH domain-containing protein n=1 Tax=Scophthalmus maximus TaxID=52904 RepID=A0A8D3DYE6_SCOMX
MAAEEQDDAALLVLIYQHLKVNGFQRAAKGLEKHVARVETPEESSNLHDIYTGWMKLCSLAQHAKQEAEDSATLKKRSIKAEPATSEEEEAANGKLAAAAGEEEEADAKPPAGSRADAVDSSAADLSRGGKHADAVSERRPEAAGETGSTNPEAERPDDDEEDEEEEETKSEQESAPVEASAEATNGSCDCEEAAEDGSSTEHVELDDEPKQVGDLRLNLKECGCASSLLPFT